MVFGYIPMHLPLQELIKRLLLLTLGFISGGCATYIDHVSGAHKIVDRGDFEAGVREINAILGVSSYEDLPDTWSADRPLAVLERAMLLQALGHYEWSARDISAAETELEWMDLDPDTAGKIGAYIYSDSAKVYKAQPTERLALNALNMLNHLALGDLEGAGVEARRFTLAREYLESLDEQSHGAFGSYLAGFVFEQLGETDRALRYYEEALDAGDLQAIRAPVLRLSSFGSYSGRKLREYLEKVEESVPREAGAVATGAPANGEILVVFGLGRVPYKIPERIPVGAALGIAGVYVSGDPDVLAYSLTKVLAYPEMVGRQNLVSTAMVKLDDCDIPVELLTDLGVEIAREYETIKPKIIGAALTRLIARAAVAEGARAVGRKKSDAVGLLAALAVELALVALDKPDTRSWTFLPNRIFVSRMSVPPGLHEIRIDLLGRYPQTQSIQINVFPYEYRVIVIMEPR